MHLIRKDEKNKKYYLREKNGKEVEISPQRYGGFKRSNSAMRYKGKFVSNWKAEQAETVAENSGVSGKKNKEKILKTLIESGDMKTLRFSEEEQYIFDVQKNEIQSNFDTYEIRTDKALIEFDKDNFLKFSSEIYDKMTSLQEEGDNDYLFLMISKIEIDYEKNKKVLNYEDVSDSAKKVINNLIKGK